MQMIMMNPPPDTAVTKADLFLIFFHTLVFGSFPKEAFMGMIMRTPPNTTVIDAAKFLSGVHNNMDENDSIEKISGVSTSV